MLIGLNGEKGAGKDTVGAYLVDKYGFERLSFAEKLKQSAAALFDIEKDKWEEWKNDPTMEILIQRNLSSEIGRAKLKGEIVPTPLPHVRMSAREFLQRYGTESHRDIFGEDFWVDALLEQDYDLEVYNYCITDARFPNELTRIKDLGGKNLRIERQEVKVGDTHRSELPPAKELIDHTIYNNGTFEDLYKQVDAALELWQPGLLYAQYC